MDELVGINGEVIANRENLHHVAPETMIFSLRGKQVILDRDIAEQFGVKTFRLNEQVKRNERRFPESFRFQLSDEEVAEVIANCDRLSSLKFSPTRPYAFTEQGVAMLTSVLHSETAIEASIRIMDAFVKMRHFLINNAAIFQRLESVELKQLGTERKINEILNRLDDGSLKPKLGIFFDGQMFDANVLVEQLVSKAQKRIVLIDDYITAEILQRFNRCAPVAAIDCYVKARFKTAALDRIFSDFNAEYPSQPCQLHVSDKSHDRWLIIDNEIYHFGASIKDLGKRWFSVDRHTEYSATELLARL